MDNIILANQKLNEWCGTKGVNFYEGDTALGLLFRYAVPKLTGLEIRKDMQGNSVTLHCLTSGGSTAWKVKYFTEWDDLAHKLFWAIYEVIK